MVFKLECENVSRKHVVNTRRTWETVYSNVFELDMRILVLLKAKAVPLHATEASERTGGITPTHSRPRY
jgi:hypothetical protein